MSLEFQTGKKLLQELEDKNKHLKKINEIKEDCCSLKISSKCCVVLQHINNSKIRKSFLFFGKFTANFD